MAYNYFNPYQQMAPAQLPNQDERIWVQSAQAAENYLMAPNSFVRLWDSNAPVFYERRTDQSGRPYPIEIYEYKKKVNSTVNSSDELLTRFNELVKRVDALEKKEVPHVPESNADDQSV